MKACGACGLKYRGKGSRMLAMTATGARFCIACPSCSKESVSICMGSTPGTPCKCGTPAAVCNGCANVAHKKSARQVVNAAIKMLELQLKAYTLTANDASRTGDYALGLRDGLRQAIDKLTAGDFVKE